MVSQQLQVRKSEIEAEVLAKVDLARRNMEEEVKLEIDTMRKMREDEEKRKMEEMEAAMREKVVLSLIYIKKNTCHMMLLLNKFAMEYNFAGLFFYC